MFNKRIAFYISDQHLVPHGGVGSFFKGFAELCRDNNWIMDVILDKAVDNELTKYANWANYYWPTDTLSYAEHNANYPKMSGDGDSYNMQKIINFQRSQIECYKFGLPDAIVINTPEALLAVAYGAMHKYVPTVYYTHQDNAVYWEKPKNNTFNESYLDMQQALMGLPGLVLGTQSQNNIHIMHSYMTEDEKKKYDIRLLPLILSEKSLLEPYNGKREGVMFVGRFEPRKQPELFAKVVKEAGLKPKCLTNGSGKRKFEELFAKLGIEDYEIKASIIGQEKVEFLKSAKVAFHPSFLESYGYSAWETLHCCPTLVLDEYRWKDNFTPLGVHITSKKEAAAKLKELHDGQWDEEKQLKTMKDYDAEVRNLWISFFDTKLKKEGIEGDRSRLIEVLSQVEKVNLNDYWFKHLNRDILCIPDVKSVLKKRSKIEITHTKKNTWLSLKPISIEDADDEEDIFKF